MLTAIGTPGEFVPSCDHSVHVTVGTPTPANSFFKPYLQMRLPSRFYDPALAPVVGRPIDGRYEVTATGEHASGRGCDESTNDGQIVGMTFDNPESQFNGAGHFADINANILSNSDGPEAWYTDAFGRNGRTTRFTGSIRQWLSKMDNQIGVDAGGPVIGGNRDYSVSGVHAPTELLALESPGTKVKGACAWACPRRFRSV